MSLTTAAGPTIEVHLGPEEWAATLRDEAAAGLTGVPRELSPTWLYDERGCQLFEAITRLPEYYPTRAEHAVLAERADEVACLTGARTLVELGAGTSEKTRLLLDALVAAGSLERFVPFDVAEPTLRATATAITDEYPELDVVGVVGDFRRHLSAIPRDGGPRLVAFLGGTVGNLAPEPRAQLFAELAAAMAPGDGLLLGTDLVKDPARLVAAYDDAAGVTAEFNRNVLAVLNRELGADFDGDAYDHVARWDEDGEHIEMHLRARRPMEVRIPALGLVAEVEAGETIRTEISAKFRREGVAAELGVAGLEPAEWWTDPDGDYAVSLWLR